MLPQEDFYFNDPRESGRVAHPRGHYDPDKNDAPRTMRELLAEEAENERVKAMYTTIDPNTKFCGCGSEVFTWKKINPCYSCEPHPTKLCGCGRTILAYVDKCYECRWEIK